MKRNILKNIYIILLILIAVLGVSYAIFNANFIGKKPTTIDIKGLTFRYTEESSGLNLEMAPPTEDGDGVNSSDYFDFSILLSKKQVYSITYNIYLKEVSGNTLSKDYVKVYLTDQNNTPLVSPTKFSSLPTYSNDTNSYLLFTNTISVDETTSSTTHTYRLRMWLDSSYQLTYQTSTEENKQTATIDDAIFKVKVNVDNLTE